MLSSTVFFVLSAPLPHHRSPRLLHRPCIAPRTPLTASAVDLSPPSDTPISTFSSTLQPFFNPPPPPVILARQPLIQEFAVLLMRSGYNAVDELDFVAMQTFQANFFDIRSREWERFIEKNLGMRQGIITDPRYFDFISFAQMKTIQKFMRDPATVFEEVYGDETGAWKSRIVKRDAQLFPTPQSLLFAWQQRVGDVVLNRLLDTVQRPQPVPEPDVSTIRTGISDIYDYFQAGGFCLKVIVTNPAGSQRRSVCDVELVAPCTLWGARALRACRSIPNDYDVFCVNAFAKRCGVRISCDTLFSKTSIVNVSPCRKIVRGEK